MQLPLRVLNGFCCSCSTSDKMALNSAFDPVLPCSLKELGKRSALLAWLLGKEGLHWAGFSRAES